MSWNAELQISEQRRICGFPNWCYVQDPLGAKPTFSFNPYTGELQTPTGVKHLPPEQDSELGVGVVFGPSRVIQGMQVRIAWQLQGGVASGVWGRFMYFVKVVSGRLREAAVCISWRCTYCERRFLPWLSGRAAGQ